MRSPTPSRPDRSRGFTLIELMIVVVVIAALASIAIIRMYSTRGDAYVATMKQDLVNMRSAQEAYFDVNQMYASSVSDLSGMFRPSENVTIEVDSATDTGWGATADHSGVDETCRIAVSGDGAGPPECEEPE